MKHFRNRSKALIYLAHPTRLERVTFAFGGLPQWHYAASFGIGRSTDRKNRVLRVPATTFVITQSRSRSKRRDGFNFYAKRRGRATEQVRLRAALPGPPRMAGGHVWSRQSIQRSHSLALCQPNSGNCGLISRENRHLIFFTTNLGREFESLRARQIHTMRNKITNPAERAVAVGGRSSHTVLQSAGWG